MALRLVQYADASPDIGWPRDGTHYVVLSGSVEIGSIVQSPGGPQAGLWNWSITVVIGPMCGFEPSKEDAQRAFADAWRAWLARAGLVEVEPDPDPPKDADAGK